MSISRYKIDDTFRQDFTVSDPSTGAAVDADADPDIEVYEDGDAVALLTGNAAKRAGGTTGQYTFGTTLTVGAGFEVGKTYNVYALATVGGVLGKTVIATFVISTEVVYAN